MSEKGFIYLLPREKGSKALTENTINLLDMFWECKSISYMNKDTN